MFHYEKVKSYRDLIKDRNALLMIDASISAMEADLDIEHGRYEQALDFGRNRLQKTDALTPLQKVVLQFSMAKACEKAGKTAERKQYLEYVAKNGKNTYMANIAREKLAELKLA